MIADASANLIPIRQGWLQTSDAPTWPNAVSKPGIFSVPTRAAASRQGQTRRPATAPGRLAQLKAPLIMRPMAKSP